MCATRAACGRWCWAAWGTPIFWPRDLRLDIIGAEFVRDVEAGEMVVINAAGVTSLFPFRDRPRRFCIFEYIYFARPTASSRAPASIARQAIGAELASEAGVPADVIIPCRIRRASGAWLRHAGEHPFDLGIIRNHCRSYLYRA